MKKSLELGRVRRSESQIKSLLREKEQGAMSLKEFCKRNSISEATYYNWRERYSTGTDKQDVFVPLRFSEIDRGSFVNP